MRKDVFNFKITKDLVTTGKYQMPVVKKFSKKDFSCEFLIATPFNFALTEAEPQSKICHFYLDDYQFERVWREPDVYVPILKKFNAVIGADFSMYINLSLPQQMYNNWRNKVLMSYWQSKGVKVIPNIQWSDEKSFEYCFDGIEPNGIVAICTSGCCQSKEIRRGFMNGYNKMLEVLKPTQILCIGTLFDELKTDTKIIKIDNFMEQRRKIWAEGLEDLETEV